MRSGPEKVAGRSHRSRDFPAHREQLVVGREAVQVGPPKEYRTVRRDEVVGMLVYPDGGREVVARDGWSIRVEPTLWNGGAEASHGVDVMVPPDLHIPMMARDRDRVPQPLGFWPKWRLALQRHRTPVLGAVLLLLIWVAVLAVATMVTGRVPVGGVIGGLLVGVWSYRRQRRTG
jgi:zinc protease